jgi:anti-sigma B factor antagonist
VETDQGLEVAVEPAGGHAVVRVAGELDIATRPTLAAVLDELLAEPRPDVVVDMEGVRFADASTVALFVSATRRARTVGGRLRLRNLTPLLERIFAITRVETVLEIEGERHGMTWRSTRHD